MTAFSPSEEVIRPSLASRLFLLVWPALILVVGFWRWIGERSGEPGDGWKIMLCAGLVAAGLYWMGMTTSIRLTADAIHYRWRGRPLIVEYFIRFADVTKVRRIRLLGVSLFDVMHDRLEVSFVDSGRHRKVNVALASFSAADARKVVAAFETACPRHCAWM